MPWAYASSDSLRFRHDFRPDCNKSLLSHRLCFLLLFLFAHTKHEEQKENEIKEAHKTSLRVRTKQLKQRKEKKKEKMLSLFACFFHDEIN